MHSRSIITAAATVFVGQALATDAIPVTGSPAGVVYRAELPEEPFFAGADIEGNVRGFISGSAPADGNGVAFTVSFENLPTSGGPFAYHLHAAPAVDGNCTSTLAHLDPFMRGQQPPCDSSAPQTCEVGDLSGKHGTISSTSFTATYTDPYVSLEEGVGAFFGNRSFVIHYANSTRLTCANFVKVQEPIHSSNHSLTSTRAPTPTSHSHGVPTGTGSFTTTSHGSSNPTDAPLPGAASVNHFSVPMLLMGLAAVIFAL
ncbi:superoxide dismutase [Stachybotrys elegans]|uniref:superoxide dismutase n=1 Tax=Stachybotrys elegans TaxID=80388 RepID=A0A8K0T7D8_9HYPO|nr:superoxide dismutase [Stachybotrys elegans]